MTDVERIAAGLTKAQKDAVLLIWPGKYRDYIETDGRVRINLFSKGVFAPDPDAPGTAYRLTPLGLAVRAHLLAGEG